MVNVFGSAFNQDISDWDITNVTDMGYMFSYNEKFNQSLYVWGSNINKVTSTSCICGYQILIKI